MNGRGGQSNRLGPARRSVIAAGLVAASATVHVAILFATRPGGLAVSPASLRCQAGETARVTVSLRLGATSTRLDRNVEFSVRGEAVRSLGGGLFSCVAPGSANIVARWQGREAIAPAQVAPAVIAIELPREAPPPLPLPEPPRARPRARERPATSVEDPPRAGDPPPDVARAAEIVTAEVPKEREPEDAIVTQAGVGASGSGLVAAGGTATVGLPGAKAGGAPDGKVGGTGVPGGRDLSRAPSIIDPDPCRGYFPDGAEDDSALVDIDVSVDGDGRVQTTSVLGESPQGQGFGSAARRCFSSMHLRPALDRSGRAVPGRMRLRFHFTR
jgi:hypothetical protein